MTQQNGRVGWPKATVEIVRGSLSGLYQHWALALFSLLAAFTIWFVIQDVENPRVEVVFPGDGLARIEVVPTNADQFIPVEDYSVSLLVEGREDDLASLTREDFRATVDVQGIPEGIPTERQVRVRSLRDGVRVLEVRPATISVVVVTPLEQEVPVTINPSGQLGQGLAQGDLKIEPPTVTIRGLPERVANVRSVDLDVNLSALREGETAVETELTARSEIGTEVDVAITPARGKATFTIAQLSVQRDIPVSVVTNGQLAAGFRVVGVTVDPPLISVTGPKGVLDGLGELLTEEISVSGANSDIRLTRNIQEVDNTILGRRSVTVEIRVRAIECGTGTTGTTAPCGAQTFLVAPTFSPPPPAGFLISGGVSVEVRVSGPLTALNSLQPSQIIATVSLAGAIAGTGSYPVAVTLPANSGLRAEHTPTISVTLVPVTSP